MKLLIAMIVLIILTACTGFPVSKTPEVAFGEQINYLERQTIDLRELSKILLDRGMVPKWKKNKITLQTALILTTSDNLKKALLKAGHDADRCYVEHNSKIMGCKKRLKSLYKDWEQATIEIFPCLVRQKSLKKVKR